MTNTKAYREMKMTASMMGEQQLATLLVDLGQKAASQSDRASRATWQKIFAVQDVLKEGWSK